MGGLWGRVGLVFGCCVDGGGKRVGARLRRRLSMFEGSLDLACLLASVLRLGRS